MSKHTLNITIDHCVDNVFEVIDNNDTVVATFETNNFTYEIEDGEDFHVRFRMEPDYLEWNIEEIGGYMSTNGITHIYSFDNITEDKDIHVVPFKDYDEHELTATEITIENVVLTEENYSNDVEGWKIYYTTNDNSIINKYGLCFYSNQRDIVIDHNHYCFEEDGRAFFILRYVNLEFGEGNRTMMVNVYGSHFIDENSVALVTSNEFTISWENISNELYSRKKAERFMGVSEPIE